ncbi:MAG: HAMP domain-containing sensor histidine kinase [Schleiferiaceae bacterium]|nr:HAMP domain-containing sensor histidine kinase [Schleiferiaceae bacterium]
MSSWNSYFWKSLWKGGLLSIAVGIGILTLIYTEQFTNQLRIQENKRIELWGEAISVIVNSDETSDLTMATRIIEFNTSIPLILTDNNNKILTYRNLSVKDTSYSSIERELKKMIAYSEPIIVNLSPGVNQFIYRNESISLKRLRSFPRFLLGIIGLYIFLAYLAFSRARKSEQDLVWNGMAKETAHQLGTPLSALFGWVTILEEEGVNSSALQEIKKDLERLQTVAFRFSKIGSDIEPKSIDIIALLNETVEYLQRRSPKSLKIKIEVPNRAPKINIEPVLIGWVIENLVRNAIDAMEGKGVVNISLGVMESAVYIDISDSGKGISSKDRRAIFKPGYTTKKRGWGLGLSLAKRIIETSHRGKLYLLHSQLKKGSIFRIELNSI